MLLTISTDLEPATDLGYLLHKHPDRVHTRTVSVGSAHVFYPERTPQRCTAALFVEVDPVGLVRGRRAPVGEGFSLGQYVNDRPYAASSMLSVALKTVFATALNGRCDSRPELAATPLPLRLRLPALPSRGGVDLVRRVFTPLGWEVEAAPVPLDPDFPQWGESRYLDVTLTGRLRLADALNHVYVLLPVLDDAKHYGVDRDEVDKLLRAGDRWLPGHPERYLITRRYLVHRRQLTATALARLAEVDDTEPEHLDNALDPGTLTGTGPDHPVPADPSEGTEPEGTEPEGTEPEGPAPEGTTLERPAPENPAPERPAPESPAPLAVLRRAAVVAAVRGSGARQVADLGCGEGALVRDLLALPEVTRVVAADVSARALTVAARKLRVDRMVPAQRERLELLQSSLVYRDTRLRGLDAAVLMEVIEHVDPGRLPALERSVFGDAAPGTVIVTTPNIEYNVRYPTLSAGTLRHRDHRFEWTRAEFAAWAERVATAYGYQVRLEPVGVDDPEVGSPTQLAAFERISTGKVTV
ncbi:MAG: 3' terminal RNA ribose 2'-O-methyltransferase Hen1 [Kineosporiaceae bacterium]